MIAIPLDCLRDLVESNDLSNPFAFLGIETLGKSDWREYIRDSDLLLNILIVATPVEVSNHLHEVSLEPTFNGVQYNMHDYDQVTFYLFDMVKCKVVGYKVCWDKTKSIEVINKLCLESSFIRVKTKDNYVDYMNLYNSLKYSFLSPEYITWVRKYVEILRCMSAVSSKDYFLPELQYIMNEHISNYPVITKLRVSPYG